MKRVDMKIVELCELWGIACRWTYYPKEKYYHLFFTKNGCGLSRAYTIDQLLYIKRKGMGGVMLDIIAEFDELFMQQIGL